MGITRPRWSYPTKLTVSLLALAFVVYLLFRFSVVIPPFILAAILAYIISPLADLFHKKNHLPRILSILLGYLVVLLIAASFPVVLIPLLASEVSAINVDIQALINWLAALGQEPLILFGRSIDIGILLDELTSGLQGIVEPVISRSWGLLVDVVTSFVWVIFIFIVSFYLVKDGDKLRLWVEQRIPPAYRQDYILLRLEISQVWAAFFRGQITLATVVAIIFICTGFLLGLPFALLMGVLAGLLEFLPSIGHGIWLTIAGLLAFFLGSTWIPVPNWVFTLILIGLHIVFQQFDLNYLIPRIIGGRVHLPPLVVILGIVAGAVLAGVLGIPLAAPTIASSRILGRYIYASIFDLDPFEMNTPAEPSLALPQPPSGVEKI